MSDASQLIMGSGAPSATFREVNTEHKGVVTALETMQVRNFKTKLPETWDDGNPKMQAVLTLQTDERDPQIENDDGVRKLYVSSKGMREAIAGAVRKAGAREVLVGGKLAVKYTRDGDATENGLNPPKVYAASYQPPPAPAYDEPDDPGEYDQYPSDPF